MRTVNADIYYFIVSFSPQLGPSMGTQGKLAALTAEVEALKSSGGSTMHTMSPSEKEKMVMEEEGNESETEDILSFIDHEVDSKGNYKFRYVTTAQKFGWLPFIDAHEVSKDELDEYIRGK